LPGWHRLSSGSRSPGYPPCTRTVHRSETRSMSAHSATLAQVVVRASCVPLVDMTPWRNRRPTPSPPDLIAPRSSRAACLCRTRTLSHLLSQG
jgi:hypothetical protein